MNPAIFDSLVYVGIGIIAAGVIHIVFVRLKQRAAVTETKMDDLIVQSLGTPLVMLAFFIPFFLAVQHALSLYTGVSVDHGSKNFNIRLHHCGYMGDCYFR